MTEQLLLHVGGMTCTGCEARVSTVLGRLDGVRQASADHQTGEVRVLLDPDRTSAASIGDVITGAGYEIETTEEVSR